MPDHSLVAREDEQARTYDWSIFRIHENGQAFRIAQNLSFHHCSEEMRYHRKIDNTVILKAKQES